MERTLDRLPHPFRALGMFDVDLSVLLPVSEADADVRRRVDLPHAIITLPRRYREHCSNEEIQFCFYYQVGVLFLSLFMVFVQLKAILIVPHALQLTNE